MCGAVGDDAVDRHTANQWERLSGEKGQANIWNFPRSGRPHTAQTPDSVQCNNPFRMAMPDMTL